MLDLDGVFEVLQRAHLHGFAGACAETAVAINDVLFEGKGKLVTAANTYLWENEGEIVGHIAVEWGPESYWDAEGEKPWEEIESWGMLDPDDSTYDLPDEDAAQEVSKLYLTRAEMKASGCTFSGLAQKKAMLQRIKAKVESENL